MNINFNALNNTNYTHQTFGARFVAKTKNMLGGKEVNIDLFKLGYEDRNFLNNWLKSIDFSKLYPKLNQLALERWSNILKYCITGTLNNKNISYLAVCDNKPCGIVTYTPEDNGVYVDGICSVPIESNKKVKFVGKTLFYQVFIDANNAKSKEISLDAVNNGPFNVVDKYETLGFKKDPTTQPYTKMICNKYKIADQLQNFSRDIFYESSNNVKVDLNQFLD